MAASPFGGKQTMEAMNEDQVQAVKIQNRLDRENDQIDADILKLENKRLLIFRDSKKYLRRKRSSWTKK